MNLVRSLRRFLRSRGGSILPLAAVAAAFVFGALALSVDVGSLIFAKRRAQTAVDLAALTAAQSPSDGDRLARLSLTDNGFATPDSLLAEPGIYKGDIATVPAARFTSGATPANAVRLTMQSRTPLYFGAAILRTPTRPITAAALATKADFASFSIGSRLAGVQGGVANSLLGAMLGTQLTLTAMDYGALASAKLDAFGFARALASGLNLTAGSYDQVMAGTATLPQVASAAANALSDGGAAFSAVQAMRQVAASLAGSTATIPLSKLFSFGPVGAGSVGGTGTNPSFSLGAFELLSNTAEIANGTRQVSVSLGPVLPGIADSQLTVAIGDRPQGGSWTGVGGPGTTVQTPQTRMLLVVSVPGSGNLGTLRVPIYLELGSAQATLTAVTCPYNGTGDTGVTLLVTPSAVEAAIAPVAADAINLSRARPDLTGSATLASLLPPSILSIAGHAETSSASPTGQSVSFSSADIAARTVRTVTSTGMTGGIATSLLSKLTLTATTAGIATPLPATVQQLVLAALTPAAPAIDQLIDTTMRTLGIGIGQADVWVNGVQCGRAVLVQ